MCRTGKEILAVNRKVIIASDSTTDLSPELIERYQVRILPLNITLGDRLYRDGVDIDPDFIYRHYEENGELPKTSAPNIAEYTEFFEACAANQNAVVFFTISSDMSSSYSNACVAAQELEEVYVVDTKNLSTGGGLLVSAAGDMAAQGLDAKEIAKRCEELSDCVDASFVIDKLEFLYKGGRCSAVAAVGASVLKLKPCIVVRGGKMSVGRKYRGSFAAVLKKYIADQIGDASDIDLRRVFVTHAGCDDAVVGQCVQQVRELAPFEEVLCTRAGCTVSSHCGRNTLGVLFIRKHPPALS